jgi:hypothetical protein
MRYYAFFATFLDIFQKDYFEILLEVFFTNFEAKCGLNTVAQENKNCLL